MRLVHDQHQVVQPGQLLEVALAKVLRQTLYPRCFPAPHLGVDLRDVEDIDLAAQELVVERPNQTLVVVPGDHGRRLGSKLGDAFEDVLGRVGREVGDQLVIDGQVGRQHKEVVQTVGQVQVADECTHQARLSHPGGQRETHRREVTLKIGDGRELGSNRVQYNLNVMVFLGRRDLGDAIQNLQRAALRRAQTQPPGDGVDVTIHDFFLLVALVAFMRFAPGTVFARSTSRCTVSTSASAPA